MNHFQRSVEKEGTKVAESLGASFTGPEVCRTSHLKWQVSIEGTSRYIITASSPRNKDMALRAIRSEVRRVCRQLRGS
jgi:hypothetical protein